jgi:hypothetical protein
MVLRQCRKRPVRRYSLRWCTASIRRDQGQGLSRGVMTLFDYRRLVGVQNRKETGGSRFGRSRLLECT